MGESTWVGEEDRLYGICMQEKVVWAGKKKRDKSEFCEASLFSKEGRCFSRVEKLIAKTVLKSRNKRTPGD